MTTPFTKKEKKILQAAGDGDLGLVGSLLKQTTRVVDTVLIIAAAHGHLAIVNKLLASGAKPLGIDADGNTALIKASQRGHEAIVTTLLSAGADVNRISVTGESALTLASTDGHDGIVELLLMAGAQVNHTNKRGTSALMGAAMYGHTRVVEKLLMAGANPNAMNVEKTTALLTAASNGFVEIVTMLLSHGANVQCTNETGETPLLEAAAYGHKQVVEHLLAAGADINAVNNKNETALILAAGRGHEATCHALLRSRANQDIQSQAGDTVVQRAMKNGHLQVVALLQDYPGIGLYVDSPETVFQAVQGENEDVIRGLYGQWLDVRGPHNRTPMHLAAELGRLSILQLLIERNASISNCDDAGATPLHVACAFGQLSVVSLLLMRGADWQVVDRNGLTPLEVATMNGHVEIVSELARQGVDVTIVSHSGRTLLHHATQSGNSKLVMFLLGENRIDVNAVDTHGWTALHYAVQRGDAFIVATLLQHGADVNRVTRSSSGSVDVLRPSEVALHGAIRLEDSTVALTLLRCEGIDVNIRNSEGQTPLMLAVSIGRPQIVSEIIKINSHAFNERCIALTNTTTTSPNMEDLNELVVLMTSVLDLRWILTLLSLCDTTTTSEQRAHLLKPALNHIIACKLVFDDDACVRFKLILEYCEAQGLLQRNDNLLFDRQAEKVNTESAQWVSGLKNQITANVWRLEAHEQCLRRVVDGVQEVYALATKNHAAIVGITHHLQTLQAQVNATRNLLAQLSLYSNDLGAQLTQCQLRLQQSETNIAIVARDLYRFRERYENQLEREARTKKIKMICGIVAGVAGLVLAPVFSEIAGAIMDFANPIEIVNHVYGEPDVALFLAQQSSIVLPAMIESLLERNSIRVSEFETLLRDEIASTHPEIVQQCEMRGFGYVPYGVTIDSAQEQRAVLEAEERVLVQVTSELQMLLGQQQASQPPPLGKAVPEFRALALAVNEEHRAESILSAKLASMSIPSAPEFDTMPPPARQVTITSPSDSQLAAQASKSDSVLLVDDPMSFPYHAAILSSDGNVTFFQEMLSTITAGSFDPHRSAQVQLVVTDATHETICAAEYAYLLGYSAVGDAIVARMATHTLSPLPPAVSIKLEDTTTRFPYILAVVECQGNVEECLDCIDAMDRSKYALGDRIPAIIMRQRSQVVSWSPVELACHLGYVDIIKELFREVCSDVSSIDRIQAIKQARQQACERAK